MEGDARLVPIAALWHVLISGLAPIWPTDRTSLGGVPLGDVWPCEVLKTSATEEWEALVPFHKLTGWTTYSLVEPLEKILGWKFEGKEHMTGLPEYRNGAYSRCLTRTCHLTCLSPYGYLGGLLLDIGVLSLKQSALPQSVFSTPSSIPQLPPSHPAIIEWRAMTVIEL